MDYSEDFEIPVIETQKVYSEKAASEQAFYSAASYSDNPIDDYHRINAELSQKGDSELFNIAKRRWIEEQQTSNKVAVVSLINDASIDAETKKRILVDYSLGGGISTSLKDKFSEKIASVETGITKRQKDAQDAVVRALPANQKKVAEKATEGFVQDTWKDIKDISTASGVVALDFAKAIPLSIAGLYTAIKEQDAVEGQKVAIDVINKYRTGTLPKDQEEIRRYIEDKIAYLGVPGEWVREKLYNATGNINTAVTLSYFLDPVNYVPFGLATKAARTGIAGATKTAVKGAKKLVGIKPDTPATTASIANPKQAADLLTGALEDPTDMTAKSLGTTKGEIIAEVLPKLNLAEDASVHPDLRKKLETQISEDDAKFKQSIEEIRFDPNVQDAAARISDREKVFDIIRETRGPTYMQNKSFLENTVGDIFEGKAVFGRDSNYFFSSRTAVINAYEQLTKSLADLPAALKGDVTIVDQLSGKRYTPEKLKAEPALMSKAEFTKTLSAIDPATDIPGWKDKEILAKTYEEQAIKASQEAMDITRDLSREDIALLQRKAATLQKQAEEIRGRNQLAVDEFYKDKQDARTFVGETPPKQLALEWTFTKRYDQLEHLMFGDDAVSANLGFGKASINVDRIARSSFADWILAPGTLPTWFEQAAARTAPRAARQAGLFINKIKKDIASTPYRAELAELISQGMEKGKEIFSPVELRAMFPKLKEKAIEDLYETHVKTRRLMHYTHAYINYQKRHELYKNKFVKGLYVDGTYRGAINQDINFTTGATVPSTVWDFDLDSKVGFTLDDTRKFHPTDLTPTAYDIGGKRLALLAKPIDINGEKFEYALIGTERVKADLLPDIVVPRVEGYFPRAYKEHFFIDKVPTKTVVNGYEVRNESLEGSRRLANYKEAIAAASTRYEAEILLKEMKAAYEGQDIDIVLRPAREDNFGNILEDYEVHGQILRHAQQRGEHLPTVNGGRARIEDPLGTLVATVTQLTRTGAMMHFDDAVEKAFVRDYREFLSQEKFPTSANEIKAPQGMDEATAKKFQEARTVFNRYAKLKSFDTKSADVLRKTLYSVADVIESFKVPANLVRDLGNKSEAILNLPRKLAATLYISLFPQKQYIVQMQTFMELAAMFPTNAVTLTANTMAVRAALMAEASGLGGKAASDFMQTQLGKATIGMEKGEFDATLKAIKSSGLLESIDLNMMVHGMFNELDRPLVETFAEQATRYATAVPKTITKVSKTIGFDNAETINRIGLWLAAKDMWKARNPGKDWNTPKAIEEISFDEWSLSGSMSRAGSMAYQNGLMSNLFQFAAITHKLTMNLFQDNATRLTTEQRVRLGLARMALWGTKHGLPLGEIVSNYVASFEDERLKETMRAMEKGLIDRAVNGMLELITGESSELNFSKAMSPYTEYVHPAFSVFAEMSKAWDGKPGDPRFPVFSAWGSIGDTYNTFSTWFATGELKADNWEKIVWEAANVAAGMSNTTKAILMLETKDKLTKMGQPLGLEATTAEAYGQAFGITTYREDSLWKGINAMSDRKAMLDTVAKDLHKHIVILRKDFPGTWQTDVNRLSSLMTMLEGKHFTPTDKVAVITKVIELDKQNARGTTGSSFLMDMLKTAADENDIYVRKGLTYLKDYDKDPKVQELLDLTKGTK